MTEEKEAPNEHLRRIGSIFAPRLREWYRANKRELPWRGTTDPYRIWISEVVLQQTRVDQGIGYYLRFVARFPDVRSLAVADEEEVLLHWQGLGYYSRARNLHAAARMIVQQSDGVFPSDYWSLLRLKGVGEYTAAAIASIAWGEPCPVVDGNVMRFLSRLLAVDDPVDTAKGKRVVAEAARVLMDAAHAGEFNQALMEFGALHCTPSAPGCDACPFADVCLARAASMQAHYPVKQGKTKVKERWLYYFHIRCGCDTYLVKRPQNGIWGGLYEFPSIESERPLSFGELERHPFFAGLFPEQGRGRFRLVVEGKKHVLSHRRLTVAFYRAEIPECMADNVRLVKVSEHELDRFPVHRLMQTYLENYFAAHPKKE